MSLLVKACPICLVCSIPSGSVVPTGTAVYCRGCGSFFVYSDEGLKVIGGDLFRDLDRLNPKMARQIASIQKRICDDTVLN